MGDTARNRGPWADTDRRDPRASLTTELTASPFPWLGMARLLLALAQWLLKFGGVGKTAARIILVGAAAASQRALRIWRRRRVRPRRI